MNGQKKLRIIDHKLVYKEVQMLSRNVPNDPREKYKF
jgi:hypothetical protein